MSDYDLYYWPIPFRGQFVRAVLAYAGKTWTEKAVPPLMGEPVESKPVPFIGPPVLIDKKADFAIAQMSAVVFYLGETLDLLPKTPQGRALTLKIVNDCNDVIDEVTLDGGREMWTKESWKAFQPRIEKWMSVFEEIGRRHGLKIDSGFMLGGTEPGIADIVTATMWSTMVDRLPKIRPMLEETTPLIAAHAMRISALPALATLAEKAKADYGDAYCGGQIGASLKKMAG